MKQVINTSVHSKEIEEIVLGQSINFEKNKLRVISLLNEQDFFFSNNKLIFKLLSDIEGNSIEISHILNMAKKNDVYNEELPSHLVRISNNNFSEIDITFHINHLREKTVIRKLVGFLNNSINKLKSLINAPEKLLDDYRSGLDEISLFLEIEKSSKREKLGDILNSYEGKSFINEIRERFLNKDDKSISDSLDTGFDCIDSKTLLLNKSNLIILAARPAIGKTSFALNIAVNLSMRKIPVGFFSLEMSSKQIAERTISMLSKIPFESLRKGTISKSELNKIEIVEKRIKSLPFFIFDHSCSNISTLIKEIKNLKKEEDIKIVFIDYIQLLNSSKNFENRQGEVAEISRKLKLLAIELDIPIFCLSQLSRKVEDRQDRRPIISDLRDSGQIEQDADVILFLYNRDQQKCKVKEIEVFLGKNRHGGLFSSFLNFDSEFGVFEGIDNGW